MIVMAGAIATEWSHRAFNRAGIILWNTEAAGDLYLAVTARMPIFAMGSVIRMERCHGNFRQAGKAIIIVETGTMKCGRGQIL
jgi:hypothetical protein